MEKHVSTAALTDAELTLIDRYWRAANYLSIGQIYLLANPLLREPLKPEHIKPRLLGHWGTTPGLNFIYAHLNRLIRARDPDIIYMCGPGHGGRAWSPTPISKASTARLCGTGHGRRREAKTKQSRADLVGEDYPAGAIVKRRLKLVKTTRALFQNGHIVGYVS